MGDNMTLDETLEMYSKHSILDSSLADYCRMAGILNNIHNGTLERKNNITDDKLQELINQMQHKSENIKARFEPSVFVDVVNALKELRELRKDKIYTEEDL